MTTSKTDLQMLLSMLDDYSKVDFNDAEAVVAKFKGWNALEPTVRDYRERFMAEVGNNLSVRHQLTLSLLAAEDKPRTLRLEISPDPDKVRACKSCGLKYEHTVGNDNTHMKVSFEGVCPSCATRNVFWEDMEVGE